MRWREGGEEAQGGKEGRGEGSREVGVDRTTVRHSGPCYTQVRRYQMSLQEEQEQEIRSGWKMRESRHQGTMLHLRAFHL